MGRHLPKPGLPDERRAEWASQRLSTGCQVRQWGVKQGVTLRSNGVDVCNVGEPPRCVSGEGRALLAEGPCPSGHLHPWSVRVSERAL